MHSYIVFYFVTLTTILQVLGQQAKPRVCTVWSRNKPYLDDVPEINYALRECGNAGTIILNTEDTFNIRSPINLSLCRTCKFRINGIMKISSDWRYWSKQPAVFKMSRSSNVVISSDSTGTIDANFYGWERTSGASVPDNMPRLFSISDRSSQIYIRNQVIQNAPGTIFHVQSGSSAVRIEGIDIQGWATTGYRIENAQHVYIWRNAIRASKSCIIIAQDTSNVQIEETNCLGVVEGDIIPNGIELNPYGGGIRTTSIRNIYVKSFWMRSWANAISITSGEENNYSKNAEITNATFTGIDLDTSNRQAVFIGPHRGTLTAKDILFKDFTGISQVQSDLKCPNAGDVCEFKQEGWNVTIAS